MGKNVDRKTGKKMDKKMSKKMVKKKRLLASQQKVQDWNLAFEESEDSQVDVKFGWDIDHENKDGGYRSKDEPEPEDAVYFTPSHSSEPAVGTLTDLPDHFSADNEKSMRGAGSKTKERPVHAENDDRNEFAQELAISLSTALKVLDPENSTIPASIRKAFIADSKTGLERMFERHQYASPFRDLESEGTRRARCFVKASAFKHCARELHTAGDSVASWAYRVENEIHDWDKDDESQVLGQGHLMHLEREATRVLESMRELRITLEKVKIWTEVERWSAS